MPGDRRLPGRQGIPRVVPDELDAPALDRVGRAPRPIRVHHALLVAIVLRIGVDDHALGAVLLGEVHLDAAEAAAVAHDHDLAGDADAELVELRVILRQAVVHVDQLARHVAGRRVGVVAVDDVAEVLQPRERLLLHRQLLQRRLGHRDLDLLRPRQVDVVGLQVRVEPVAAERGQRGLDDPPLVPGANEMRPATQAATQAPDVLGAHPLLKARLIRTLHGGVPGGEPVQLACLRLRLGGAHPARAHQPARSQHRDSPAPGSIPHVMPPVMRFGTRLCACPPGAL